MGKKTSENFSDKVDKEMSWRKMELSQITADIDYMMREDISMQHYQIEYRIKTAYVMLYSHWEGCVKELAKMYVDSINDMHLSPYVVRESLRARFLKDSLESLVSSANKWVNNGSGGPNYGQFLKDFSGFGKIFYISPSAVNTESNLNPKVLTKILENIGLYELIDDKFLDKDFCAVNNRLLGRRNAIAHGNKKIHFGNTVISSNGEVNEVEAEESSEVAEESSEVAEESSEVAEISSPACIVTEYLDTHKKITGKMDKIADLFRDAWEEEWYLMNSKSS